jgi:hypothetical protein
LWIVQKPWGYFLKKIGIYTDFSLKLAQESESEVEKFAQSVVQKIQPLLSEK